MLIFKMSTSETPFLTFYFFPSFSLFFHIIYRMLSKTGNLALRFELPICFSRGYVTSGKKIAFIKDKWHSSLKLLCVFFTVVKCFFKAFIKVLVVMSPTVLIFSDVLLNIFSRTKTQLLLPFYLTPSASETEKHSFIESRLHSTFICSSISTREVHKESKCTLMYHIHHG